MRFIGKHAEIALLLAAITLLVIAGTIERVVRNVVHR